MDPEKNYDNINPKVKANPVSLLVFWWLKDLFWKGTKKDLDYSDLYDTLPVHKSVVLGHKLERNWQAELEVSRTNQRRPRLLNAIWRTFHIRFIVYGCGLFIYNCVFLVLTPVLLKLVIQHFSPDVTSTWGDACRYTMGLVLCGMTSAVIGHHCNSGNLMLGMMARVACCSLVYRKTLQLSRTALGTTANKQLVDLLSNDLKRFDQSTFFLHYIWILPMQAAIMSAITWQYIGPSALVGIGSIFLQTVPVQILMGKCTAWLRVKLTSRTAERVGLISEVVSSIQFIKMLAWEKPFEKLIEFSRRKEIDAILKASYLRGLSISFMVFPERVALFLALGCYVLLGNNDVTADKVFSIAACYTILSRTMAIRFTNAIQIASETMVSVRRIERYLLEKEFETKRTSASNRNGPVPREKMDVALVNATARWTSSAISETIFKISLNMRHGKLCAVIGPPGSGKSSLIQAILGELPLSSGTSTVMGNISFASQEPWLLVGTIRQNILFGQPYEPKRYKEVVRVCALQKDFEIFSNGDKTIVSEKGISLSAGQRARINLARAVYRKSDIYLLDDPLSAIDGHIGHHILEDCICSYIAKKTRLIVTNQLQCLEKADHIVVMNNGQIEIQGSFQELQASKLNFETILTSNETEVEEQTHKSFFRETSNISIQTSIIDNDEEGGEEAGEEAGLLSRKGSKMAACVGYVRSGGSVLSLVCLALLLLLWQAATSGTDYWVAIWTREEEKRGLYIEFQPENINISSASNYTNSSRTRTLAAIELDYGDEEFLTYPPILDAGNTSELGAWPPLDLSDDIVNGTALGVLLGRETSLYVYAACVAATVLLTVAKSLLFFKACIASSGKLHAGLCHGVLRATMKFFQSVSSDRVMSRFSTDFAVIDETLPRTLNESFQIHLSIIGALVLMIITNYILIVPMVFVAAAVYKMCNIFTRTIQAMRRLEGTTCGPVLTHLSTTLDGLATIRASSSQDVMSMDFYTYQDIHTSAFYLLFSTITASAFWFDFVANIFVGCVSYSFLLLESGAGTPGSDVGLAISQSMIVIGVMHYGIRCAAESANYVGAVQRVLEYTTVQEENGFESAPGKKPSPTWPSSGAIQFDHLSVRCTSDNSPALRDVTVTIQPGQKVGVLGCTGASKTSFVSSLFRLAQFDGAIKIDQVDTRNIGLRDLRSRISFLSQEPVVFTTSLRNNLDPYHVHSNDKLWSVLQEVELKDSERSLLIPVGAGGSNYSKEQKQLICLARAILSSNKILIVDEDAASMDLQRDVLIRTIIGKKFKDCTVLTVAHSPKTVIEFDRVMVMDAGAMVEFGHPHILLQNPEGYFYKMVHGSGPSVAEELYKTAQESYRLNEPEAETPEHEED